MIKFIKMECPDKYVNINNITVFEVLKQCDDNKWIIYASSTQYSIGYEYKKFNTEKEARKALENLMNQINGTALKITQMPTENEMKIIRDSYNKSIMDNIYVEK